MKPKFANVIELYLAIKAGKIDPTTCSIYFDGGVFFVVDDEGERLINDGDPEEALADLLGMERGIL